MMLQLLDIGNSGSEKDESTIFVQPRCPRDINKSEVYVIIRIVTSTTKIPLASILSHLKPFRLPMLPRKTIRMLLTDANIKNCRP